MLSCGTIRAKRKGFPRDIIFPPAMERRTDGGDHVWRCQENLIAMAWYDRGSVHLICTIHPP